MKAFYVFSCDPLDGTLLVFAETASRARYRAFKDGLYDWSSWDEYTDIRARRAPEWDKYADSERVVETNDDLPDGAPPFYNDEGWGE